MRIAYLVARYPAVSQTFVVGEVLGLRRLGVDVHTLAIRRSPPEEVLSRTDREAFASTYTVLPPRPWHLLRAHVRALARSPRGYASTLLHALALGRLDLRAVLWQLFYFVEAMVVWDQCDRRGIRHLHVHFPNVAADVAMLVARYGGEPWTYSMTLHGPTELYDVNAHRLPEKVRESAFSICISDYTRSQVMNFVGREHWAKLHVVHCGVDTDRFSPTHRWPGLLPGSTLGPFPGPPPQQPTNGPAKAPLSPVPVYAPPSWSPAKATPTPTFVPVAPPRPPAAPAEEPRAPVVPTPEPEIKPVKYEAPAPVEDFTPWRRSQRWGS